MEFYCPVPNCGHVGTIITKIHYRLEHGEEKETIEKKYGTPKATSPRGFNNRDMSARLTAQQR